MRRFLAWAAVVTALSISSASTADGLLRGSAPATVTSSPYSEKATASPYPATDAVKQGVEVSAVIVPWGNVAFKAPGHSSTEAPTPKSGRHEVAQGGEYGARVKDGEYAKPARELVLPEGSNDDKGAGWQKEIDKGGEPGGSAYHQQTTSPNSSRANTPSKEQAGSPYNEKTNSSSTAKATTPHDEKARSPATDKRDASYSEKTSSPTTEPVSSSRTDGVKSGVEVSAVAASWGAESPHYSSTAVSTPASERHEKDEGSEYGAAVKDSSSAKAYPNADKRNEKQHHDSVLPRDPSDDNIALSEKSAATPVYSEKTSSSYVENQSTPSKEKTASSFDAKRTSSSNATTAGAVDAKRGGGVATVTTPWGNEDSDLFSYSSIARKAKPEKSIEGDNYGEDVKDDNDANAADKRSEMHQRDSNDDKWQNSIGGKIGQPQVPSTASVGSETTRSPFNWETKSAYGESKGASSNDSISSPYSEKKSPPPDESSTTSHNEKSSDYSSTKAPTPKVEHFDKTEEKRPVYDGALGRIIPWNDGKPQLVKDFTAEKLTQTKEYGHLLSDIVPWRRSHSLFSRDLQSEELSEDERPPEQPQSVEQFAEIPGEQNIEQPGEQPTEQTTEQTVEQPTKQTIEQPGQQPDEQTSEQSGEQPDEQPDEQPADEEPIEQTGEEPVEQPTEQPVEQPEVDGIMKTTVEDTMVRWDQDDCNPCDVPTQPPTLAPIYPRNDDDYEKHFPNVTDAYESWKDLKKNLPSNAPTNRPKKIHCTRIIGEYGESYECESEPTKTPTTETTTETATETPYESKPEPETAAPGPTPAPPTPSTPSEPTSTPSAPSTPGKPTSTPSTPRTPREITPTPPTSSTPGEPTPAPSEPGEPVPSTPGGTTPAPSAPTDPGKRTPSPPVPNEPDKPTPAPSEPSEATPAPTEAYDEPTPTPAASTTEGDTSTTYPTGTKASTSKTTKPVSSSGTANTTTGTTTGGIAYGNTGTTDTATTGADANVAGASTSTGTTSSGSAGALSGGAITGIVIACIVFVAVVVGAVLYRQRSIARQREENLFADLSATGGRPLETDYAAM